MQPVYTPLSFLKRFLIGQTTQLTVKELTNKLTEFNDYFQSVYRMSIDEIIETTMFQEQSPFSLDTTDTIRLDEFPIKMNNLAYDYLVQSGKPNSLERIIKQLSKRTKMSYDQVEEQLNVVKDIRFVEVYGCDRWLLTEWEICNEEVYELLNERDSKETNTTHVYQLISTRLQNKEEPRKIWLPEIDNRFIIHGNGKLTIEERNRGEQTNMNHVCGQKQQENQQQEQQQQQKSESPINDVNQVHQKMFEQFEQSLYILKKRNEQMADEVVAFFNDNNLDAIHKLMEEKQANNEIQHDVCKLIEKWKK